MIKATYSTFISYLLVGLLNTLLTSSIIFAMLYFGFSDIVANFFGIFFGMAQSFVLNSRLTFNEYSTDNKRIALFFLVLIFSYLINLCALILSKDILALPSLASQMVALFCYVIVSYSCLKIFVFNKKNDQK